MASFDDSAFDNELFAERLKAYVASARVSPLGGVSLGTFVETPAVDHSVHSLFTPPQESFDDVSNVSALQMLVQMAMNKSSNSSIKPPPFAPVVDNSDSLFSCLSERQVQRTNTRLSRQTSSESGTSSQTTEPLNIASVSGRIMELATDRNGSRLLQKLLTQGGVDVISRVIDEVEDHLPIIMCDTYANYMCQQLFQAANAIQRIRLLSRLAPQFIQVARDRRGTHSLQALISHITTPEEEDLLARTIRGKTEQIALDTHATHVLQQAISCCLARNMSSPLVSLARLDFVFAEVASGMDRLAVDPNALGVVKRCITHSQVRGYAGILAEKIGANLFGFVENPYANYAVQHALEVWSSHPATVYLAEGIVTQLVDRIAPMALHKFASNVAEMAIKSSQPAMRRALIESLHYGDDSRMLSLMRSPFGVFVTGTAIKNAEDPTQASGLTLAICKNLKKLPEGRNKSKWEKLLGECAYKQQFGQLPNTPSTVSDCSSATRNSRR